jgi:hypothetical protein
MTGCATPIPPPPPGDLSPFSRDFLRPAPVFLHRGGPLFVSVRRFPAGFISFSTVLHSFATFVYVLFPLLSIL